MLTQPQREDLRTAVWRGNPFVFLDVLKAGPREDYEEAAALIIGVVRNRLEIAAGVSVHIIAHYLENGTFFYEPNRVWGQSGDSLQREGTMEIHPIAATSALPSDAGHRPALQRETAMLTGGENAMLPAPAAKTRKPRSNRGVPRGPYKKHSAASNQQSVLAES